MTPQRRKTFLLVNGSLLALVFLWAIAGSSDSTSPDAPDPLSADIACQRLMESRLVSPGSAKFAIHTDATVQEIEPSVYRVQSYVDSDNALGANIRTHYDCTVRYESGRYHLVGEIVKR